MPTILATDNRPTLISLILQETSMKRNESTRQNLRFRLLGISWAARPIDFLRSCFVASLAVLGLTFVCTMAVAQESNSPITPLAIGESLPEFELKDHHGTPHKSAEWKSAEWKKATAVVFVGVECPLVKLYNERLTEFQERFGDGFQIIGIDSNRHDSLTDIATFAKDVKVKFPILKDSGNAIADAFGAQRTPQVFLFDKTGVLRYRGAIDDQYTYGKQKREVETEFLASAIKSVLAGEKPETETTESDGCIIGRILEPNTNSDVTYANQVSRILNVHCVSCHREGEIAPFSLTDYDEVVGWAEMISEVTAERRMPPWHANPAHGKFANDISLTKTQIKQLADWVSAGAPFGDKKDLPEPPQFDANWQIGKPDVIIPMAKKPFMVPATGVIDYKYYVVDPGFTEDKWVEAAECKIGNREVVHHIIVGIHGDETAAHGQVDSEWITATAPGSPPLILEKGFAKLIPAGSKLVFQMHYTPNGVAQSDLSSVAFKFTDAKTVKKTVGTREVINTRFRIPPGADNHEVKANFRFRNDSMLLTLFPHMHVRGKSFRYTAVYPDGRSEILLDIPRYDFNWQNGYKFPEPKLMPAGTKLECVAHFDNSEGNFSNPDPSKHVRWGDQTWDEMMIGYFDMALTHQDLSKGENNPRTKSLVGRITSGEEPVNARLQELAQKSLNSDGNMTRFGAYLATRFTNIDRVCVTTVKEEKLNVVRVIQRPELQRLVGGKEVQAAAKDSLFAKIIGDAAPTAVDDLSKQESKDAQHMAKALRSSFHVPIVLDGGEKATLNFWSKEDTAFPESVSQLLVELCVEMKQ